MSKENSVLTTLKEATTNCLKATIKKTETLFRCGFVQPATQKCVAVQEDQAEGKKPRLNFLLR